MGLYGGGEDTSSTPRREALVVRAALQGRALADVLLWLEALYLSLGPASLEGAFPEPS